MLPMGRRGVHWSGGFIAFFGEIPRTCIHEHTVPYLPNGAVHSPAVLQAGLRAEGRHSAQVVPHARGAVLRSAI